MKVAKIIVLILGILPFTGTRQGDAKGVIGEGIASGSNFAFSSAKEVQYPSPTNSSKLEKPCWASEAPLPVPVANWGQIKQETKANKPAPTPFTDHHEP